MRTDGIRLKKTIAYATQCIIWKYDGVKENKNLDYSNFTK